MRITAALFAMGLAVIVGCNGSSQDPARNPPPAAPDTSPSSQPAPMPPEAPAEPQDQTPEEAPLLVMYTRSGGIAGRHEVLEVYEDGRLEFDAGPGSQFSQRVDPQRIETLRQLIESPQFFALEGPYKVEGADLITYTVTARTSQGEKTVVRTDGAERPPHLHRITRELDALRSAATSDTGAGPGG